MASAQLCVHGQAHFQCGAAVAGNFLVIGKMELPIIEQEVMQIYLWPQSLQGKKDVEPSCERQETCFGIGLRCNHVRTVSEASSLGRSHQEPVCGTQCTSILILTPQCGYHS